MLLKVNIANIYQPGLNFSAQSDVRVGLQWEDFLGKCNSKLLRLFGLHWVSKGGKMVKERGGNRQNKPPLLRFFGLPRGVKRYKIKGVICILPPHSYTILPPFADQKSCKSGVLICLLPSHSYTILPPLEAQCSPKNVRVLSCIFQKNPPSQPTLTSFYPPPPWQPNSYIIIPPQSYIVLAPIPENCQS